MGSKKESNQSKGLELSKQLFYGDLADTIVRLKGGKLLKFNKTAFIINAKSEEMHKRFSGNLQELEVVDFPDIGSDTFKLFLNCTMGFEGCNFETALKIFPVAWNYKVEDSISQCLKALQIKEMNPKVCEVLNIAASTNCDKLLLQTYSFIFSNSSPCKILENEEYCYLLEPESVGLLLTRLQIDSYVLKILIKWGNNYIKKNYSRFKGLRNFLGKCDLLRFFKLEYFETAGAISEFCLSKPGKGFFTVDEVFTHLQSKYLVPGKSEWKTIKKNGSITEEIIVPTNYYKAQVKFERNKAVFYYNAKKLKSDQIISCEVTFIGQSSNGDKLFETQKKFSIAHDSLHETVYTYHTDDNFVLSKIKSETPGKFTVLHNFRPLEKCIFKITWTFFHNCRILLMNRAGDELNGSDQLYFTKDVSSSF